MIIGVLYLPTYCSGESIRNLAGTFRGIRERQTERPVNLKVSLSNLIGPVEGSLCKPVCLFSPWGPPYKRKSARILSTDLEMKTLQEMSEIWGLFSWANARYLLMPADTYGYAINNLDKAFVDEYFSNLAAVAKKVCGDSLEVKAWSSVKIENANQYELFRKSITTRYFADGALEFLQGQEMLCAAEKTARFFNPASPETAAKEYCIERMTERYLIPALYGSSRISGLIKVSLVRKEKDVLDGDLPRVYVIKNKAPWLAGGE